MLIDWNAFDWQSFATLATGFAAVTGATIVGRRQVNIAARQATIAENQNSILERQTALAEITLRHELFDRRLRIYETARAFLTHILAHATPPPSQESNDFLTAMNTARLLFRPQVHAALDGLWRRAGDFHVLYADMQTTFRREGHYGEGDPERERLMLDSFSKDLAALVDWFGDEIRLADQGMP